MESAVDERAVVLKEWPQPGTASEARIWADEHALVIRYFAGGGKIVVVRFPSCMYVMFGGPNDEALGASVVWEGAGVLLGA